LRRSPSDFPTLLAGKHTVPRLVAHPAEGRLHYRLRQLQQHLRHPPRSAFCALSEDDLRNVPYNYRSASIFLSGDLRVRRGALEYVHGHWRGNPALGMKRGDYRVEPSA
jgi:hypothetical protein